MRIDILTLFPEMCDAVMSESVIGRARKKGAVEINFHQIRDFAVNKHNQVDDTPYGGGEGMLSNVYARSFYDFMGCIDNIDVNLNKLTVANGNQNKQRILGDVIVQANLAEASLENLPIEQRSVHSTAKFINQVGDFSKYLNNKLISGNESAQEIENLKNSMKNIGYEIVTDRGDIKEN